MRTKRAVSKPHFVETQILSNIYQQSLFNLLLYTEIWSFGKQDHQVALRTWWSCICGLRTWWVYSTRYGPTLFSLHENYKCPSWTLPIQNLRSFDGPVYAIFIVTEVWFFFSFKELFLPGRRGLAHKLSDYFVSGNDFQILI